MAGGKPAAGESRSLFTREGDGYRPTRWARGPWNPNHLHGGPSAVLLAHLLETQRGDPDFLLTRMTLDMFRPVPLDLLGVEARVVREGRRIRAVDASVTNGGKVVARASGVFLRRVEGRAASVTLPVRPPLPGWRTLPSGDPLGTPTDDPDLFHRSVDMRLTNTPLKGESVAAWALAPFDFVPGVPLSPVERVASVSDFVNAMGMMSRNGRASFINVDLSLYLLREPRSDWICLESVGRGDAAGLATSNVNLHDEQGLIGHVAASCLGNDMTPSGENVP